MKVCGVTSTEDALLAATAGANIIGVIFAENSPRRYGSSVVPTDPEACADQIFADAVSHRARHEFMSWSWHGYPFHLQDPELSAAKTSPIVFHGKYGAGNLRTSSSERFVRIQLCKEEHFAISAQTNTGGTLEGVSHASGSGGNPLLSCYRQVTLI